MNLLLRAGESSRGIYVLHPLVVAPLMLGVSMLEVDGPLFFVAAVVIALIGVWASLLLAETVRRTSHGHALV
ncbi:MAG: hypothetical protein Q7J82_06300 [Coriobacteriia bacterium]|nr:hypothetical protein [Coriobacteriia bacterium]